MSSRVLPLVGHIACELIVCCVYTQTGPRIDVGFGYFTISDGEIGHVSDSTDPITSTDCAMCARIYKRCYTFMKVRRGVQKQKLGNRGEE